MPILKCPTCGATLSVDSTFPVDFRCPKCMGIVPNPPASESGGRALPVLPLEKEARLDQIGTITGIVIAVILLAFGIAGLFAARNFLPFKAGLIIAVMSGIGICLVVISIATRRERLDWAPPQPPDEGKILDYQRPLNQKRPPASGFQSVGLFLIGLVLGPAAIVGTGPLIQALRLESNTMLIVIACVPGAGIALAFVPGLRSLGVGILLGIGASLLIVVSICAMSFKI